MNDDFSQALVACGDSVIPSYVDDSQPWSQNTLVDCMPVGSMIVHEVVSSIVATVQAKIAKSKAQVKGRGED